MGHEPRRGFGNWFVGHEPRRGAPTDWYRNNNTGDLKWFDGSGSQANYTHVAKSGTFNSVTEYNGKKDVVSSYRLNADGSASKNGVLTNDGTSISTDGGHTITTKDNTSIWDGILNGGASDNAGGGSGSHQKYGIISTTDDKGMGSTQTGTKNGADFFDVDEGGGLLSLVHGTGAAFSVVEVTPRSTAIVKSVEELKDAATTGINAFSQSTTTTSTLDPMFLKKGNNVYRRSNGYTYKMDGKGGATGTTEKANDTFPKQKTFDAYHPL